ncbi:UNVERIFIED_CONTAM: DNA topoisomerase 2 [Sesamum radiatum]|uniref:DNA topoisomerase 2 n=1 Tax=Sesamum radiatum TaxID=300843 RepID=A0AAW2VKA2_SESRA
MGTKSEPIISKCKAGENWTKITFKPDLAKFSMTYLEEDVVALMKKRVIDVAGCLGKTVKVELNGRLFHFKSFSNYCDLYLKPASASTSDPLPRFEEEVHDRWQICISRSEGQFQQVSFVNGIATVKGGTHVDYVTNKITSHLVTVIKNKNKKNKKFDLKPHAVKNHLWVFVNALIDNPAFDSQTKETLTLRAASFGSSWDFSSKFLDKVAKSDIMKNIEEWAEFKQKKDLKKTDGSKDRRIYGLAKLADANEAGGKNSERCTLILTEGDSAKALAHIKQILGLQHGKQYDSVKSLRYGHLMIMTDQDHDGSHIKGLLINFIHSFWPSLLKVPSFLLEFITPIVKYEAWKEKLGADAKNWSIKYYKGLGTSTDQEGKEYFEDLGKHKKDFVWVDEQDGEAIELAFSKKKIEARKNWIRQFEPGTYLSEQDKHIKYRDFVHKELILFSIADLQRSIPSMVDGLKPGQRKILFCSFKRNFIKEAKVAQFSGYVSEHSAYHHGEQSLASTIIGMAQDYVGSNNINLLLPNGQFGTRGQGGKDHASARYIFTQLSPLTRYLFPKADDILLNYLNEDGQSIEPTWYVPIIPMVLVNGSEGIGTGWSSFIPNYNPLDIIANLRHLLNDEPMDPMHPWYKGFRELPVRKWTQDYKEFLESISAENDKSKDPFIERVLLANLENDMLKCENKCRFIQCVVEGSIIVSNRRRADLFLELKEKGFTPFPKKKTSAEVAIAGSLDEAEETEENTSASDYDYLLSLAIGTLTAEKIQELRAERDKLLQEVEDLKRATIKSLWMNDLDALESKFIEEQNKSEKKWEKEREKINGTINISRPVQKIPRKNNKKATNKESQMEVSDNTAPEAGIAGEIKKPRGRAAAKKKAPAEKVTSVADENDDEEISDLRHRLAAYNFDSSPDSRQEMETEEVSQLQTKKKEPSRKAAAQKQLSTVSESPDDDDDIQIIDDDDDFAPEEKKKKGGRKPANAKAAKPPAATKKRGPATSKALGQKLITEVLKPAENSPEKKVRKVRASPFNKKSGSILGRTINVEEEEEGETSAEQADSTSTLGSVTDVGQAVPPRARPQRANRGKATYVISDDSESDDPAEDFESDAAEDDSDFDDED